MSPRGMEPEPTPVPDLTMQYVGDANGQVDRLLTRLDELDARMAGVFPPYAYEQVEPFQLNPPHEKHQALSNLVVRLDNMAIRLETLLNALGASPS